MGGLDLIISAGTKTYRMIAVLNEETMPMTIGTYGKTNAATAIIGLQPVERGLTSSLGAADLTIARQEVATEQVFVERREEVSPAGGRVGCDCRGCCRGGWSAQNPSSKRQQMHWAEKCRDERLPLPQASLNRRLLE